MFENKIKLIFSQQHWNSYTFLNYNENYCTIKTVLFIIL